jgi:hypothetical protein
MKLRFQRMKRLVTALAIANARRPPPAHWANLRRETASPTTNKGVREMKNRFPKDDIPSQQEVIES